MAYAEFGMKASYSNEDLGVADQSIPRGELPLNLFSGVTYHTWNITKLAYVTDIVT